MKNWPIAQQLFWKTLIWQMWLGETGKTAQETERHTAHLRKFIEWAAKVVLDDLDKRSPVLREVEDLALHLLRILPRHSREAIEVGRTFLLTLLEPVFSHGLLRELDPVFRRLIGFVIGLDLKLTQILGFVGPEGQSFEDRILQDEVERQACEVLKEYSAKGRSERLRYLLPFSIGILRERTVDASIGKFPSGQPLRVPIHEDVPLLFLPLAADPALQKQLFEHFRNCFEEAEPSLARLIGELLPELTSGDPAISQRSLRSFYRAYLLSAHFQLTRNLPRGAEYLANLSLAELDTFCGSIPVWSKEVSFPELIKTQLREAKAIAKTPSQPQESSTLPILLGPSELALALAGFSGELLQRYPEDQRLDALSHWAEMAETGIDLFDSLRWLGVLLHVAYCFPDRKVSVGGKEKLLREWLTDHLLKVLRYKPQKSELSASSKKNPDLREKNPGLDTEFFRRSIHAKVLRLAFQVVASPVHQQALFDEGKDHQTHEVAGELLMRGIVLAHRIAPVLLHHTRLRLEEIDRQLSEAMNPEPSPWMSLSLRDQFNPELYGPEPSKYDHLLAGTLAVFRGIEHGRVTAGDKARVSAPIPFWLTRPVRRELLRIANLQENEAQRQVREAREQDVPNRLQTFLNRTPQEYAIELFRLSSGYGSEEDLLLRGQANLLNLLQQASEAASVEINALPRKPGQPDLIARVRSRENEASILIEVKTSAEPRHLRQSIDQLRAAVEHSSASYGLILVPSVSERSKRLCEENNIGYLDLQGNAFVKFDGVFIKTVESKKKPPKPGRPKSLFAPVSTRAMRVLLAEPHRRWKLKDLAEATRMSLGQTYKVKEALLNQEFIEIDQEKKLLLKDPAGLLDAWQEAYRYENNQIVALFSLDKIQIVEEKIKQYCDSKKIRYAFTLFSGAAKLAPFTRYGTVAFYFAGDKEVLQKELNFKPVDSGATILLLSPYDEGVLQGLQEAQGYKIVNAIQLYLDLYSYGGRGREQAEFLREKLIGF